MTYTHYLRSRYRRDIFRKHLDRLRSSSNCTRCIRFAYTLSNWFRNWHKLGQLSRSTGWKCMLCKLHQLAGSSHHIPCRLKVLHTRVMWRHMMSCRRNTPRRRQCMYSLVRTGQLDILLQHTSAQSEKSTLWRRRCHKCYLKCKTHSLQGMLNTLIESLYTFKQDILHKIKRLLSH